MRNIELSMKVSEINIFQIVIDKDEVCELFPGNDPSKLKPQFFKPFVSPTD